MRLLGINAPEEGECFYDEATDYLIDTLKGQRVTLETHGKDQFGRVLGHVFTGNAHVNLDLVSKGYAIAATLREDEPFGKQLLEAEEATWRDRIGLWAEDACGASNPLPDVVIGDLQHNPSGPDDEVLDAETVTIVNRGSKAVNLTGWTLRDESSRHRFSFPNGTKLDAGEEMVVSSADHGWNPGGTPVWNNDGDMAMLLDKQGRVVDRVRY